MPEEKTVKIALRGDDIKMLDDALSYVSSERQDIASYLCYLKNTIAEQMGIEKTWDTSKWTDKQWEDFFKETDSKS